MTYIPYKDLTDKAFWTKSVSSVHPSDIDPSHFFDMEISSTEKIATAGSCFAQHIARHLKNAGFNYYVVEKGHSLISEEVLLSNNYGTFSARYGNIYTARQLLQLIKRAIGQFIPSEGAWASKREKFILDPFRPSVQQGGFISEKEMLMDRQQHLLLVKEMFEKLDIFIFTLGLTECWVSKGDGSVFPICPGVEGGEFSWKKYEFYNQSVHDVISDMNEFVQILAAINADAKIILTVSPVPLMATAEKQTHVLNATTYSKSVLRVAAEELARNYGHIHYFPSYEIITSPFNRGKYFADDLRNVTEEGVSHVMNCFLKHTVKNQLEIEGLKEEKDFEILKLSRSFIEVECDEEKLDRFS